jgi:hypothetical protein
MPGNRRNRKRRQGAVLGRVRRSRSARQPFGPCPRVGGGQEITTWSSRRTRGPLVADSSVDVGRSMALVLSLLNPHAGTALRRLRTSSPLASGAVCAGSNPAEGTQRNAVMQGLLPGPFRWRVDRRCPLLTAFCRSLWAVRGRSVGGGPVRRPPRRGIEGSRRRRTSATPRTVWAWPVRPRNGTRLVPTAVGRS